MRRKIGFLLILLSLLNCKPLKYNLDSAEQYKVINDLVLGRKIKELHKFTLTSDSYGMEILLKNLKDLENTPNLITLKPKSKKINFDLILGDGEKDLLVTHFKELKVVKLKSNFFNGRIRVSKKSINNKTFLSYPYITQNNKFAFVYESARSGELVILEKIDGMWIRLGMIPVWIS